MTETYDDGTIVCGTDRLEIHSYYFPFGTKSVPYTQIKGLQRIEIKGLWSGKWRFWGTGNPHTGPTSTGSDRTRGLALSSTSDARSVPSSPPTIPTRSSPCSAAERTSEWAMHVR